MAGDFTERIAELRRTIGTPFDLQGSCVVDQVYLTPITSMN